MGIPLIMAGLGIAGLAIQAKAAHDQKEARQEATAASVRAENLRQQQMELEAQRRNRESFRKQMVANAITYARAQQQGVAAGSSVIGGALGEQWGTTGRDVLFNEQSLEIGQGLFDENRNIANAQGDIATAEGLGKFGSSLVSNSENIAKIGNSIFTGSLFSTGSDPNKTSSSFTGVGAYPY